MTKQQVVDAALATLHDLRWTDFVPNPKTRTITSTGNLADHGFGYSVKRDGIVIYLDTKAAPYVPYTNEPWVSPKWHGKKNPNEGWWERFCEEFTRRLAAKLRGEIK